MEIQCLIKINYKKKASKSPSLIPIQCRGLASAVVIAAFLRSPIRSVCAKVDGKIPFCKSLVAVLGAAGWNSAWVGPVEPHMGRGCGDWR